MSRARRDWGLAVGASADALRSRAGRLRVPALAPGVRSGASPDVQLIGGAGRYEVDLLIRTLPGGQLEIVGQITVSERVYEPVFGLRLALCDADTLQIVCDTRTDQMGEFDMKGLSDARYALVLGNEEDAPCLMVWEGGARVPACEAPL